MLGQLITIHRQQTQPSEFHQEEMKYVQNKQRDIDVCFEWIKKFEQKLQVCKNPEKIKHLKQRILNLQETVNILGKDQDRGYSSDELVSDQDVEEPSWNTTQQIHLGSSPFERYLKI